MERAQLGCSHSHLGETLSLNLGSSIVNVAGDTAPATRDKSIGCVTRFILSIQDQDAKSCSVTWVSLSVPNFSSFASSLQFNSIPNTWEILIPCDVRTFRRKTDFFKEYIFLVSGIPCH